MDLISFEDFERKMNTNESFEIKIFDEPIVPCYPNNVIMLLKEKDTKYLVEVNYNKNTNEVSAPIY